MGRNVFPLKYDESLIVGHVLRYGQYWKLDSAINKLSNTFDTYLLNLFLSIVIASVKGFHERNKLKFVVSLLSIKWPVRFDNFGNKNDYNTD